SECLNRRARSSGEVGIFFDLRPAGENVSPLFNPNAVTDVVAQHDIKTREEDLQKKIGESAQTRGGRGHNHVVIYVAVDNELIGGITLVELNRIEGPLRQLRAHNRPSAGSSCHQAGSLSVLALC